MEEEGLSEGSLLKKTTQQLKRLRAIHLQTLEITGRSYSELLKMLAHRDELIAFLKCEVEDLKERNEYLDKKRNNE